MSYQVMDKDKLAVADFDKAIKLDPESDEAYFGRGYSYDKLGMTAEADADYTRDIALDPTDYTV